MSTKVKIFQCPFEPDMKVAEDILIKLHVPYSETTITIQIAPNLQHYSASDDQKDLKIRQTTISTPTKDTKTLSFDINRNKKQTTTVENQNYEIELLSIGRENMQGQDFLYFEFNVTKI